MGALLPCPDRRDQRARVLCTGLDAGGCVPGQGARSRAARGTGACRPAARGWLPGRGGGAGDDQGGAAGLGDFAGRLPALAAHWVRPAPAVLKDRVDGLITNGKFCCVRRLRLSLTWWHRPLRLRACALQADVAVVGEPDDPDVDRVPPVQPAPRRRAPVGSGLPAVSALGRG